MIINKLTKHIFIILLVAFAGAEAFAQRINPPAFRSNSNSTRVNRNMATRKLDNIMVNFLNRRLNLTDDEADKFWPLYNQYQKELTEVLRQKRANNASSQVNGSEQVDRELFYEQKILSIRKHYRDEFLKILPAEKVSLLYKSEREFKDELIKQLRERNSPDV